MSVVNDGTGSKYFMGRKRVMGTIYSNLLMTSKCHVFKDFIKYSFCILVRYAMQTPTNA